MRTLRRVTIHKQISPSPEAVLTSRPQSLRHGHDLSGHESSVAPQLAGSHHRQRRRARGDGRRDRRHRRRTPQHHRCRNCEDGHPGSERHEHDERDDIEELDERVAVDELHERRNDHDDARVERDDDERRKLTMSNTTWWYVARSSGLVAWVFLMATVVAGTLAAGRMVKRKGATRWLSDLHPWLSMLSVLLVVLHIVAIVADHKIGFGAVDVFVPFASRWRPFAIAWGVVGVWLLIAITATSLARRWMARRTWHRIHLLSYGLAVTATLHAVSAGTDFANPAVSRAVGVSSVVVLAVAARRTLMAARPAAPNRVERVAQRKDLRPVEMVEQVPARTLDVQRRSRVELGEAGVGQHRQRDAAVVARRLARDEALANQAVEPARQPAR